MKGLSFSSLTPAVILLVYSSGLLILPHLPGGFFFRHLAYALVVGTILCFSVIQPGSEPFLFLTSMGFFCLAIEQRFPRVQYSFTGQDHVKNARYFLLRRVGGYLASYAVFSQSWFHEHLSLHLLSQWPFWLQGVFLLFFIDLVEYGLHRIFHRVPRLWEFHKIHHASPELTVFAEGPDHFLTYAIVRVPLFCLIVLILDAQLEAYLYFSVVPSLVIASFFSHMNIDYPSVGRYPWWAYIISTPNHHATHHTFFGSDRNFGRIFVFWDLLFGTFEKAQKTPRVFGVIDDPSFSRKGIFAQQWQSLRSQWRPLPQAPPPIRREGRGLHSSESHINLEP